MTEWSWTDVNPRFYPRLSSFAALVLSLRTVMSVVGEEPLTWRSDRARRGGKSTRNAIVCGNFGHRFGPNLIVELFPRNCLRPLNLCRPCDALDPNDPESRWEY